MKGNLFVNAIMYVIIIIVVYYVASYLFISTISYDNFRYLKQVFPQKEIEYMQACTDRNTDIDSECYRYLHDNVCRAIKQRMNASYFYADHARFSNNTNPDGQTFHRDIKPRFEYHASYPNVYTCIFYLDNTSVSIGNKTLQVAPGDIVVFNAFDLHRAGGIDPFNKKNRRVLQLFNCFFDEAEQRRFYAEHSFCEHIENDFITKYVYYFLDVRWFFEYFNLTRIGNITMKGCDDNRDARFVTLMNKKYYKATINKVGYYTNL